MNLYLKSCLFIFLSISLPAAAKGPAFNEYESTATDTQRSLTFPYGCRAMRRGYQEWIVFSGNEGEVITPGWSKIWWWILISILTLITGMVICAMLLKSMAG